MIQGSKAPNPNTQTQITLITGSGPDGDGTIPDVYIKNKDGSRLVHLHDKNGHLDNESHRSFTVDNEKYADLNNFNFNAIRSGQPAYVTLVMENTDAICLSGIIVNGNGATYTWTGDMAHHCGAEWYQSRHAFGTSNHAPKCMWLDSDGTNKIVAKGISIHMPDFLGESGLIAQYDEKDDRLCKNTKRMTFWPQKDNGWEFDTFQPRLEYDGTGALLEPDNGIDRDERGYPDNTALWWREEGQKKRNHPRDFTELPNSNPFPDHVTVSHMDAHSARDLCESLTSRGGDFAAVHGKEKLFCDMTKKQLFDVCDEDITTACFDHEKRSFRDVGAKIRKRDLSFGDTIPEKNYKTNEVWK
ncbi:hypothetical protein K469DRAFT_582486 [Zopfia rhizophila CBS 207.26]|uniref:Uncharacterized protein n=1 Tax=Zopfia rhizophila CBS 207.26 TaxID=1314779 RepID=A0A6A6DZ44_9PEZI|nr:hypothetical protein K469DRAFT_582486 [Zopfia rhizophila CBS 207.26]